MLESERAADIDRRKFVRLPQQHVFASAFARLSVVAIPKPALDGSDGILREKAPAAAAGMPAPMDLDAGQCGGALNRPVGPVRAQLPT
jgi:hypothetical protein